MNDRHTNGTNGEARPEAATPEAANAVRPAAGNSALSARKSFGKPFPKGVSGNPSGRPKHAGEFGAMIRAYLDEAGPGEKSRLRDLIERLYQEDPKTLLAYGFGKPVEIHELGGPDGTPTIDPVMLAAAREIARGL